MKQKHIEAAIKLGLKTKKWRNKRVQLEAFIVKYINRGNNPSRGANYNTGNKWYFRRIFADLWLKNKLWCGYCGNKFDLKNPKNRPTLDHIIPQAQNGSHNIKNLTPCCSKCNKRKGIEKWEVRHPVENFGILGMTKN